MTHRTSVAILRIASLLLIGFGVLMSASLFTPAAALMRLFLDLAYLPADGGRDFASPEGRLLVAICGGLLAGWGAMLLLATTRVYAADPTAGRRIILPAILIWFALDGLGSIVAGAWFNVVMNTGFLALFAAPVLLLRPETGERPA